MICIHTPSQMAASCGDGTGKLTELFDRLVMFCGHDNLEPQLVMRPCEEAGKENRETLWC